MAYRCRICGKGRHKAHKVSHSNKKSRKWQRPNLKRVRAFFEGRVQRIRACAQCIRQGRVQKAG